MTQGVESATQHNGDIPEKKGLRRFLGGTKKIPVVLSLFYLNKH